jgi:hypothetical protein
VPITTLEGRQGKGKSHYNITTREFRISATLQPFQGILNSINREKAMSTRRRDLVGGASALALLSGSSAAFAQNKEAPAESRSKSAAGSGTGGGITIQGGSLPRPTDQASLQALLRSVAANGGTLMLDPSTPPITVTGTITVPLSPKGNDLGMRFFFNGLQLLSANRDNATPCIKFAGAMWNLTIKDLYVNGGSDGWSTPGCGNGIVIDGSTGTDTNNQGIWMCRFENLWASRCGGHGIYFKGPIFEGTANGLTGMANLGSGIVFDGIVRNLASFHVYQSNSRGNKLYGVDLQNTATGASGINMVGLSVVNNGLGAVNAPRGIALLLAADIENSGEPAINMPSSSWSSAVAFCRLSSEGHQIEGNQPLAQPSIHLIKGQPAKLITFGNSVNPYSNGPPNPYPTLVIQTP